MFHRGWFWLNTGSEALDGRIDEVARHYGVLRTGSLDEATSEIARDPRRWAGLITGVHGNLFALEALRRRAPTLPILALVSDPQPALVNMLQARGIEIAALPVDVARLTAFVQRAFTSSFLPDDRVAGTLQGLAERAQLTPREVQIISFSLGNEPRIRMRKRLGISENTLKTQIRGLLRKCNERNVDALAKNILRAALLVDRPQATSVPIAPWLPLAS
jgi:DNA-binding CsgD family transcriptional regulator